MSVPQPVRLAGSPAEVVRSITTEIDALDAEILRLVERRSDLDRERQRLHVANGGTSIVLRRDIEVMHHFTRLGREGRDLALALIQLGRRRWPWQKGADAEDGT